jgi:HEAT repeat protein
MSRSSMLVAFTLSLLALGLAFFSYHRGSQDAVKTTAQFRSSLDDLRTSLQAFEARVHRLEDEVGRTEAGRTGANGVLPAEAGEPGPGERWNALESQVSTMEQRLAGLEDDPVRRGYAFLASENAELRREGINILRRVARFDPEARAAMRKLLRDPSPRVREQAAQVLGNLRDTAAAPELLELLADPEAAVRRRAVQGLTSMEARDAAPVLAERLASDQDDRVREAAALGLGKLKSNQAAESLLKGLKDQSEAVRAAAITSLGEVGAREAAPDLRAIYDQDPGPYRMRLVIALKALGDVEPLQREVQRLAQVAEKDAAVANRRQAIRELAVLAPDTSQEVFSRALLDPSPVVRREAERALGR